MLAKSLSVLAESPSVLDQGFVAPVYYFPLITSNYDKKGNIVIQASLQFLYLRTELIALRT